jgi:hypothetical protein
MDDLLRRALKYYRRHFVLIAVLTLAVWVPCELAQSYCDAFVFGEDNFRASFRLSRILDGLFGIIATAGILCALERDAVGQPPLLGHSLRDGISCWGRMWWANVVFGFAAVFGLIAFVVPGLLVIVRGSLLPAVVVQEELTGLPALKRSFALTRGSFWRLTGWFVGAGALTLLAGCPFLAGAALCGNWLVEAALTMCFDVVYAFMTVFTWVVLNRLRGEVEPETAYGEE